MRNVPDSPFLRVPRIKDSISNGEQNAKVVTSRSWTKVRKRVLAISAGILVARHLKTADDLFDSEPSPRTESLVTTAVQWAERIMKKIDNAIDFPRMAYWSPCPIRRCTRPSLA